MRSGQTGDAAGHEHDTKTASVRAYGTGAKPSKIVGYTRKLVALQDADCTTVGREFDFGQAAAHGAEEALGEL